MIAADSRRELSVLVERCQLSLSSLERGFVVPLVAPIFPPMFERSYKFSDLLSLLNQAEPEVRRDLLKATKMSGSRVLVLFAFAVGAAAGSQIWFAVRLARPLGITPGFRRSRATLSAAIGRQGDLRLQRTNVQRADPVFLQRRIGAQADLDKFRVVVIGCGAIGGFVAISLASAGITKLTLIDDDALRTDNAMRHFLGLSEVGVHKVTALRTEIWRRLPQVTIVTRAQRVQKVMSDEPEVLLDNDLVVLATGDHALELYISYQLRKDVRLVHAWVEALGVGGHALLDAQTGRGCLKCLYEEDDDFGLICRPSLFAPGQSFTFQLAGCAGAFTPFGVLDAQGIAVEATRLALRALTEKLEGSVLVTRFDSLAPFVSGQYQPSCRAKQLSVGSRVEITEHATGCSNCAT
jgi:molybdopterin/thiamine biosynthesis adenylyltransferase